MRARLEPKRVDKLVGLLNVRAKAAATPVKGALLGPKKVGPLQIGSCWVKPIYVTSSSVYWSLTQTVAPVGQEMQLKVCGCSGTPIK